MMFGGLLTEKPLTLSGSIPVDSSRHSLPPSRLTRGTSLSHHVVEAPDCEFPWESLAAILPEQVSPEQQSHQ